MASGIWSGATSSVSVWATMLRVPPSFLMPGAASSLTKCTGTSTVTVWPRDDAQEIDVQRHAADRVELEVARDRPDGLAAGLDLEQRGLEAARVDQGAGADEVDGDGLGRLAAPVHDRGNLALATNGPGGPLADPVACHGLKRLDCAHGVILQMMAGSGKRKSRPTRTAVTFPARPCLQGCRRTRGAHTRMGRRWQCFGAAAAYASARPRRRMMPIASKRSNAWLARDQNRVDKRHVSVDLRSSPSIDRLPMSSRIGSDGTGWDSERTLAIPEATAPKRATVAAVVA